jgi:hypothetical protein
MNDRPGTRGRASSSMDAAVGAGADIIDRVQETLQGGRIKRVRIKLGGRTIREIPVQAAAFSAILIALAAAIISQLHVEVDQD